MGLELRLGFKTGLRLGEIRGGTGRYGEIRGDVAGLASSSELRRTQRLSCAWLFSTDSRSATYLLTGTVRVRVRATSREVHHATY